MLVGTDLSSDLLACCHSNPQRSQSLQQDLFFYYTTAPDGLLNEPKRWKEGRVPVFNVTININHQKVSEMTTQI